MEMTGNFGTVADRQGRLSPTKREILEMKLRGRHSEGAARKEISPRPCFENPLSFGQERIWFQCQVMPNVALFHIPLLVRLDGPLNIPALETSLNGLFCRHEVLRTGFSSQAGVPFQIISPELTVSITHIDLNALDPELQQADVHRRAAAEAQKPFDLANPPLLRVTLLALGPTRHVLLLTVHHIVWDGWSSGLMIKEIGALYGAIVTGNPNLPTPMSVQYADFAHWQRQLFKGESGAAQSAYWKRQLEGIPPLLTLPTDRPRAAVQRHRGSTYSWNLSQDIHIDLSEVSRKNGTTLFVTLLAAFNTLLFHYSGQTDVVVGTTIAYRTRPELENLIGFFTNSLVLRTNLQGNPSFETLLARVHEAALGALSNQDVPFEKLVEELAPKRGLSYNPLFQVAFVLHNLPMEKLALPDLTITIEELNTNSAAFDLVLHLFDERPGLKARLEYDADLFEQATIVRIASHFDTLLQGVRSNPTLRIDALTLLNGEEQKLVLDASTSRLAGVPVGPLLHHMIDYTARANMKAVAVVCGTRKLTYGELIIRANKLAHHLQSLGVGPDAPVCICMDSSVDMIVGILGILKADGAYVPIDPSYPASRIQYVLEDSNAATLLTTQKIADSLPDAPVQKVLLDADWSIIDRMPSDPPPSRGNVGNLAYIIYTSGSTGYPKGVMISHRNVIASTSARTQHYSSHVSAFLLLSSIAFDSSVAGIFWTLCQGGCLYIPGESVRWNPAALIRTIEEEAISHLLCLPSLYVALLDHTLGGTCSSLRCVIVAGEECKREVVERHFERFSAASLFNEYGPTECTVWSTVHELRYDDEAAGPISIGRPIPGAEVYVLGSGGALSPVGVAGELYVGGEGLARGYRGRPDVTASCFAPNPFIGVGTRLYRTGDRGRRRSNGDIEFLGRIDNQVKLRGYRVELAEIEEVLRTHSSVADVVVVNRPDKAGAPRLIAYVLRVPDAQESGKDFRGYLEQHVPDFLVPALIIPLDDFPRLPNGKIDRAALPDPSPGTTTVTVAEAKPLSPVERVLAEIWCEVLSVDDIRADDNFFERGGNSLSAIQVIARVQQLLGKEIPVTSIFDEGTLSAFAREVEQSFGQDDTPSEEMERLLLELEDLPEPREASDSGLHEGENYV